MQVFYFAAAATARARTSTTEPTELAVSHFDFVEDLADPPKLHDLYTGDFSGWIYSSGWVQHGISLAFVDLLFRWLFEHSHAAHGVYPLSFIELVLLYSQQRDASFPFWNPSARSFEFIQLQLRFERPTLSCPLALVRKAVGAFLRFMDAGQILFQSHDPHRPLGFFGQRMTFFSVSFDDSGGEGAVQRQDWPHGTAAAVTARRIPRYI